MHDDDSGLKRLRALRDRALAEIPDTPGHRARMAYIRAERRRLVALVPTDRLRAVITAAECEHGHDVDEMVRRTVNTVIRNWTLFCLDLRSLVRELSDDPGGCAIPEDGPFALDESLFRAEPPFDRVSRVHRANFTAKGWYEHCVAELVGFLDHLVHDRASELALELVDGFIAGLRRTIDANGGTASLGGRTFTKIERGYTMTFDPPPESPGAS